MTVEKNRVGEALTVRIEGRIDTVTAPILEEELRDLSGVKELTLDFEDVAYISSAGLRVLLAAQKRMNIQGEMRLIHVNEDINEVFEITGFADILTVL